MSVFAGLLRSHKRIQYRSIVSDLRKSRALIRLSGVDVAKLLQPIVSSDITALNIQNNSQYALLLSNKGRILSDCYILFADEIYNTKNTILMDVPVELHKSIVSHLSLYKIRIKVDISVENDFFVMAQYPSSKPAKSDSSADATSSINYHKFKDPRFDTEIGYRFIISSKNPPSLEFQKDSNYYDFSRLSHGTAEGAELLDCIPHESNIDLYANSTLNYTKGCYLGQELVARCQFSNTIRKRFMTFFWYDLQLSAMLDAGGDLPNMDEIAMSLSYEYSSKLTGNLDVKLTNDLGVSIGDVICIMSSKSSHGWFGIGIIKVDGFETYRPVLGKQETVFQLMSASSQRNGRAIVTSPLFFDWSRIDATTGRCKV